MRAGFLVQSPYHPDELSVLLHSYLELQDCTSSFVRVRLMDLSRCFKMLNWNERHSLFLISICKLTSREAGALLGISHTHTLTHAGGARARLLSLMNGVDYES